MAYAAFIQSILVAELASPQAGSSLKYSTGVFLNGRPRHPGKMMNHAQKNTPEDFPSGVQIY